MAADKCDVEGCDKNAVQEFLLEHDGLTVLRCETHSVPAIDIPPSATLVKSKK